MAIVISQKIEKIIPQAKVANFRHKEKLCAVYRLSMKHSHFFSIEVQKI